MAHVKYSKSKKRWIADLRDVGGKEPTFRNKEDAVAALNSAIAESETGGYINKKTSPTFEQVVGRRGDNGKFTPASCFLAHTEKRVRRNEIGGGELANKEKACEHLCEMIYDGKRFGDVRVADIQGKLELDLVDEILAGRSNKSAQNIRSILKQALHYAVSAKYIHLNPAAELSVPIIGEKPMPKLLSKEIVSEIIRHAPDRYRDELLIIAESGLRTSELAPLEWTDIDLDRELIHVQRAKKKLSKHVAQDKIGKTKTKSGNRKIAMHPQVKQMLQERWLKAGRPSEGLVFPNKDGQMQCMDNLRNRGINKACARAGLPFVTLRDLRHFFASILIYEMDETDAIITQMMGHADINFTRKTYAEWLDDRARDRKLSQRMGRAVHL